MLVRPRAREAVSCQIISRLLALFPVRRVEANRFQNLAAMIQVGRPPPVTPTAKVPHLGETVRLDVKTPPAGELERRHLDGNLCPIATDADAFAGKDRDFVSIGRNKTSRSAETRRPSLIGPPVRYRVK